jgi:hypothetical protein
MNKMENISNTKLKAFIVIGTIGVAIILIADYVHSVLNKGIEGIKLIGLF